MKEHFMTRWHRESEYKLTKPDGNGVHPKERCELCSSMSATGRCLKHHNSRVNGKATCKDYAA